MRLESLYTYLIIYITAVALGYAAWLVQELVGLGLVREDIEPITPRMVAILVQRMHFFHKYAISMGNYCYLCTVILKRVAREGALSCA